jgi:ubiquinol-cytochrome c reductase cytochrome b subunit
MVRNAWRWFDDRTGLSKILGPIARHPVPRGVGWYYVLGSATLFVFILQVVTGIALSTAYVTSSGQAYESLVFISHKTMLGSVIRGMHYFGASAMVLLIGLHAVRVYLTGSYKFPREMNWLTGAGLLLFTMLMGFTGQLLRWDQNGVWSAVIAAEQAGRAPLIGHWLAHFILAGNTVGGATLSRFFAAHVFFIPALIFLFVAFHLHLVLHNGISEPPKAGQAVDPKTYRARYEELLKRDGQPFWPEAARRDLVFGALVIVVVLGLAVVLGPPELGRQPDPTIIQAHPRPDWYLMWYFAVLALIPHGTEDYVIVYGPLLFGVLLIILPFIARRGERNPARRPWAVGAVMFAVMMIGTLWVQGEKAPWSPVFSAKPLPSSVVGAASGTVVAQGALLFHQKGCEYCHDISGHGGHRGPNLTDVADRLTRDQMTIRILNGATNMPAYGGNLKPAELDAILTFLGTRKTR